MTISTEHTYVVRDDQVFGGEPIIRGTRTPVRAVVETWRMGVPAEGVVAHLPHLTLAQVFDALSYYADHQEEMEGYIERNRDEREDGKIWLKRLVEFSNSHTRPAEEIDLDRERLFEELQG